MEIIIKEKVKRLDSYLSSTLNISRSLIEKNIKNKNILVNNEAVKAGYIPKIGDVITGEVKEDKLNAYGQDIPLNVVYEDEYLLVVDKPSGMAVHPAPGTKNNTLVNALINYSDSLSDINGEFRPGIVHRIDKDTSGLLVIAKTNKVHEILAKGFHDKTIKRKYIALVDGTFNESTGKIDAPIGRSKIDRKKLCVIDENAKKAVTNFTVLKRYKTSTLLELVLETGRTHQIRVHLNYIGHSVINDKVYGKRVFNDYGQLLHAYYLGFNHPITNKYLEFTSPIPKEFIELEEKLKNS